MILKCTCDSSFGRNAGALYQDATYGEKMREHTPTAKEHIYRCTVCQTERGSSTTPEGKPKKK